MDVLAHGLWAALGCGYAARRMPLSTAAAGATVALAVLPDLVHFIPVLAWAVFGSGRAAMVADYALATVGHLPPMPHVVWLFTHHLHCVMHSAIIAAVVTVAVRRSTGSVWFPLYGWWSHVLIDVPTHSADFYPSPVLYPLTMRGFDGVAWNEPWFMVANYAALSVVAVALLRTRGRSTVR